MARRVRCALEARPTLLSWSVSLAMSGREDCDISTPRRILHTSRHDPKQAVAGVLYLPECRPVLTRSHRRKRIELLRSHPCSAFRELFVFRASILAGLRQRANRRELMGSFIRHLGIDRGHEQGRSGYSATSFVAAQV